ncbi:hypothetical protein GCM10008940_06510 [Microbulbifer agarilyticus]
MEILLHKATTLVDTQNLDSEHVPRIGEVVVLDQYAHLVSHIEYVNKNGTLTPRVFCVRCSGDIPDDRRRILEGDGWLQPID